MPKKYPYIASGFKEDCSQLLAIFKNENDIRFETFCKCWQTMKFSLVFHCRESFADLLEFCEEALHIAKQFFFLPYTFKERIGGLYLLYGLYYKMPLDNLAKIRITMTDFSQILQLHTEIKDGEHFDANYILSKMFIDNAFTFCLFNKEMGLHKQHKLRRHCETENTLSVIPNIQNMNKPNGLLQKLETLCKEYAKEKIELSESVGAEKVVKLFDCNIVSNIMVNINHTEESNDIFVNSKNMKKTTRKHYKHRSNIDLTSSEEEEEIEDDVSVGEETFKDEPTKQQLIKNDTNEEILDDNFEEHYEKGHITN